MKRMKMPQRSATYLGRDTETMEVPMRSKYHQRFLSEEERFFSWVEQTTTCWLWIGSLDEDGYGRFRRGQPDFKTTSAHRYSYEMAYGPIPTGLQIDHLCRTRNCVWPDHLEAVTCSVNLHRSPITAATLRGQQTHCRNGHAFTERTIIRDKNGHRHCRLCVNLRSNPKVNNCADCGKPIVKTALRCSSCAAKQRGIIRDGKGRISSLGGS